MLCEIEVVSKTIKELTLGRQKDVKFTERLDSHQTYDALTQFEMRNLTLARAVNVSCVI